LEIPKTAYTGKIREITIGVGPKAVTVGGEGCYPFYLFEGEMPHPPRIAMEVWDCTPEDWPPAALEPFGDAVQDPVTWAQKCVEAYGAEMVALQLRSIDPNAQNRPTEEALSTVKAVAEAIDVPLIVWGCGNVDKDAEVLREVCEACQGKRLALGPVQEGNHKKVGAPAIGYQQVVIASTSIDVNLCKQLNVLLGNLGVPDELVLIDPTTGALGYGIEYTYSVMERIRMAALVQQDERLQFPIICNLGLEVWKIKEAAISQEEDPKMGDPKHRGVLLEAMTAMLLLLAGADVLIMRHPEAIGLVRWAIESLLS